MTDERFALVLSIGIGITITWELGPAFGIAASFFGALLYTCADRIGR